MTAINPRSVHYTGTEAVRRRTFIGSRYEVPLFLCKRLAVPVERRDNLELEVLRNGRQNLLQAMTNYGQLPNWKAGITVNLCPSWKAPKRTSAAAPSRPRTSCRKSLRNGHKEWTLPPNRYRLGGTISDCARKSTGTKGPYQCFTGDRFATAPGATGFPSSSSQHGMLREVYYEQTPREMDKLAQPRRYFVGKIRPGNKSTERPCSRLALSTATLCWRNPADPGPDRYFKGILDIAPKVVRTDPREQSAVPPPTANRHSYCAEPFRRPPPGRYDLCRGAVAPPPARGQSRRRPLEMTLNANWKPFRQPATLRMHTVDIPKRRRKRGRNMKVAFGSSTARFKDQDFFPIGALQSTIPSSNGGDHHQQRHPHRKLSQSSTGVAASNQQNHASSNFDPDEPTTVATLDRTRTKLFIVPRRRQTVATLARLLLPPSQQGGPSEGSLGKAVTTSRVKIEPFDGDDVDEETDEPGQVEVLDGGRIVEVEAVQTEAVDEKSSSSE